MQPRRAKFAVPHKRTLPHGGQSPGTFLHVRGGATVNVRKTVSGRQPPTGKFTDL